MSKKKSRITLSPFGRRIEPAKPEITETKPRGLVEAPAPSKFDWNNALIDGFIIAMITFFTTLGGVTATGANVTTIIESSTISAVAQFFVLIAVKRGVQVPPRQ